MADWLTAEQAIAYANLTTEALALALPSITVPGLPAALIVVRCSSCSALELLSLVVAEPFRRLGLAGNLLAWLVREAQRLHSPTLIVSFPRDHASTAAMQRLMPASQGCSHVPGLLNRKRLLVVRQANTVTFGQVVVLIRALWKALPIIIWR